MEATDGDIGSLQAANQQIAGKAHEALRAESLGHQIAGKVHEVLDGDKESVLYATDAGVQSLQSPNHRIAGKVDEVPRLGEGEEEESLFSKGFEAETGFPAPSGPQIIGCSDDGDISGISSPPAKGALHGVISSPCTPAAPSLIGCSSLLGCFRSPTTPPSATSASLPALISSPPAEATPTLSPPSDSCHVSPALSKSSPPSDFCHVSPSSSAPPPPCASRKLPDLAPVAAAAAAAAAARGSESAPSLSPDHVSPPLDYTHSPCGTAEMEPEQGQEARSHLCIPDVHTAGCGSCPGTTTNPTLSTLPLSTLPLSNPPLNSLRLQAHHLSTLPQASTIPLVPSSAQPLSFDPQPPVTTATGWDPHQASAPLPDLPGDLASDTTGPSPLPSSTHSFSPDNQPPATTTPTLGLDSPVLPCPSPTHSSSSDHKPPATPTPGLDSALLPGLPDDLAWAILLRVPCSCVQKMRRVCRGWRRSIPGAQGSFFRERAHAGVAEPWLYISVSDWQGSNACFAREPSTGLWHKLPPIPGSQCRNVLTLQFASIHGRLVVSGMVERDNPMDGANGVYVYSPWENRWGRAAAINTGRWFCMSGVVEGKLYVAGGIGTCNSLSLVPSVERYSVEEDSWVEMDVSRRAELMTLPGYQAVLGGKLYAKNIGWGPRLGICYDPATGEVEELSSTMVQGWQGPTAAVGGRLVIVDFGDDYKVKAWDAEKDRWQALVGGLLRLPAEGHKPWAVQLVPYLGKLCLILPNLTMVTVPLGAVLEAPPGSTTLLGCPGSVLVETIEAVRSSPEGGAVVKEEPSVLTSAVLGCQVLML